jgi:hypothetical protein
VYVPAASEHVPPVELPVAPPVVELPVVPPAELPVAPPVVELPVVPPAELPVAPPVVELPVVLPAELPVAPPVVELPVVLPLSVEATVVPLPVLVPAVPPLPLPVEAPLPLPVVLPVELDEPLLPHERHKAIAPIAATFDADGNRFIGQLPFCGLKRITSQESSAVTQSERAQLRAHRGALPDKQPDSLVSGHAERSRDARNRCLEFCHALRERSRTGRQRIAKLDFFHRFAKLRRLSPLRSGSFLGVSCGFPARVRVPSTRQKWFF